MEAFKIEHFKRDHPDLSFPHWERLTVEQCLDLKIRFAKALGLPNAVDALEVLEMLKHSATDVISFDCNSSPPDLDKILRSLKIKPNEQVYINWSRLDDVDKFAFSDLNHNLESIWYPSTDDIEIFDNSLTWVLFVTHYCTIQITTLAP